MKRIIKAVSVIVALFSFLHCVPSRCEQDAVTSYVYEKANGTIILDIDIDTEMPFSEIMLYVNYYSCLKFSYVDMDNNCSKLEMEDSGECVSVYLKQKEMTIYKHLDVGFTPKIELVQGSLLAFSLRAYVKYSGSDDFTEISDASDECTYVKGVYHVLLGDVNGDERVNTADAAVILSACAGRVSLSEVQTLAADFNNDSKINTADAKALLYYIVQN